MLQSSSIAGDAERGMQVFTKAACAKCHRFGTIGDSSGPDLTSLAKRFSKRETLQSIVDPSSVVSDQYRGSKVLCSNGKTYTGLKVDNGDGSISLIQLDATRVRIQQDEIEDLQSTMVSTMPENLLKGLSEQEIADLFAFLHNDRSVAASPAVVQ